MFVQRQIFRVKQGCRDELVQMILDEFVRIAFPRNYRVSTPQFATRDQVCWEAEFADLAEYSNFWDQWNNRPTTPAFLEKWYALTESGGTSELWRLRD